MIETLIVFSFLVGALAPLVTTVAFVLYFSMAAATAIALFGLASGAGFSFAAGAWAATILSMQVGFALSLLGMSIYHKQSGKRRVPSVQPVRAVQDPSAGSAARDDQQNATGA